jgi:undecaprenyl-diphosphatase
MTRPPALRCLLAAGVAGFAALALAYEHEPLATVDLELSEWVLRELPAWVVWLARPFSWLGGWIGLTLLAALAVGVLVRGRAWVDLLFVAATVAGTQVLVALLKAVFGRLRPELGSAVPLPESPSFPSGHATAGVASLGALAVLAAERLPSARARARLWAVVVVCAAGVGLSRVALNVHFLTDVVAGWCLGVAWLAACLLAREAWRRRPGYPLTP